jgi:hypothetical protein
MVVVVEFLLAVLVVDGLTIYRSYNKAIEDEQEDTYSIEYIEYEDDTYYSA